MDGSLEFQALNREASLALEATRVGLEAISKAHSSRQGLYLQGFFNLATAIERIGKIAIIVDHALENNGQFPQDKTLRAVGHDVLDLTKNMQTMRLRYADSDAFGAFPDDDFVPAMLEILSDFATGARYYNLDSLVQGVGLKRSLGNPVAVWQQRVSLPILEKHYTGIRRERGDGLAAIIGERMAPFSMVRGWDESGNHISDVTAMLTGSQAARHIQRWTPFYLCRLFRFYTMLLKSLSYASLEKQVPFIPWMGDHFGRFVNDDAFFKKYKVWRY